MAEENVWDGQEATGGIGDEDGGDLREVPEHTSPPGGEEPVAGGRQWPEAPDPTEEEMTAAIEALEPCHCAYPDGQPLSRRTKLPCRGAKMPNGRCRFHGGNAAKGRANGNFKTGRYSRHIAGGLLDRYKAAGEHPDLLSVREDVQLLEARLRELLERTAGGASLETWKEAREEYERMTGAIRAGDAAEMDAALKALGKLLTGAVQAEETWAEIYEVLEGKAKIAKREWDRMRDLRQLMTVQQGMDMVMGFAEGIIALVQNTLEAKTAAVILDGVRLNLDKVLTVPGDQAGQPLLSGPGAGKVLERDPATGKGRRKVEPGKG